ncbi:MAG: hypothetical protein GXP43_00695 [bacterium]|nr:hypothetical protein [bacterium]
MDLFLWREVFVWLGSGLTVVAGLDYLRSALKGEVKPNRITWFFWFVIPLIGALGQVKSGVGREVIFTLALAFPPALIFLTSFLSKKTYWGIGKFDLLMGAIAAIGVLLWQLTNNPIWAVVFSVLADASAGVPTLVKAYHHPETEKPIFFTLNTLGSFLVLTTVTTWRVENFLYPLYFGVLSLTGLVLIIFGSSKRGAKQ